jgi:hypothetical protein
MATRELGWLLRAWEHAADVVPAARGAVLVDEAGLVADLDAAIDLPVDQLATLVARLHNEQFGPTAEGVLECDSCGEVLEVEVPLDLVAAGSVGGQAVAEAGARIVALDSGRLVRVRVPTTRDLLAVRDRDDVASALLARCVSTIDRDGAQHAPRLDAADRAVVDAAVAELAGAASVVVRARCPQCGTSLSAPVDVAAFLWNRVEREAPAGLAEVADLATSFGWAEADILRLTPTRRNAYLALVRGAEA